MSLLSRFRQKYPSVLAPAIQEIIADDSGEIVSELDPDGREVLDPVPMSPPINFKGSDRNMFDIMREQIRRELSEAAAAEGKETFEEADDFDVDDDYEPSTPWEKEFDPELRNLQFRQIDVERMERGLAPRYFDDYEEMGHGAEAPSGKPEASTPEPKAPSKAPKKGSTTSDDED